MFLGLGCGFSVQISADVFLMLSKMAQSCMIYTIRRRRTSSRLTMVVVVVVVAMRIVGGTNVVHLVN